jgi:hypothetical protein
MAASNSDKLTYVALNTITTLAGSGHTEGGASIDAADLTKWATIGALTGVIFAIYRTQTGSDGKTTIVDGTYTEWEGVVAGNTIGEMVYKGGDGDQDYPAGSNTKVAMLVTAAWANSLIDALLMSLNQNGTIRDGVVNTAQLASAAVTSAKIQSQAVTPAKWTNPYKFLAARTAAHTPGNNGVVAFETDIFDTSGNLDTTTHVGRYTAPVDGFYQFNANLTFQVSNQTQDIGLYFMKNGTKINNATAVVNMYPGSTSSAMAASCLLPLAAGDYIEIACVGGRPLQVIDTTFNQFSGFLVSQT